MQNEHGEALTRRQAMAAGLAGAAVLTGLPLVNGDDAGAKPGDGGAGREGGGAKPQEEGSPREKSSTRDRLPVAFLPHGGGPWPFVELGFDRAQIDGLAAYLRTVRVLPKQRPKALLVISAHWEEAAPTVMTSERPPLLFDYYGFPPEAYELTWPAPGDPKLAARVQQLLGAAGIETATDATRGFDHGTFVPLKVTWPEAEIPTVQLSLRAGLDPGEHLAMGRALAPLRDEGVFIIGSGMSYHNMRGFWDQGARPAAEAFDAWLREATTLEPYERDRRLARWFTAPAARMVHPREEHLLPLMVVAGAAGADRGTTAFSGLFGQPISAFQFG